MNPDPATLPLRDIHLSETIGWWPPAPGWWLLFALVLLGAAMVWYSYLLYARRRYSAVNMARKELTRIRLQFAADRDAAHCVRAISGLLRRLCISVFPRNETAGLTGAEWLTFLQGGAMAADKRHKPEDREGENADEKLRDPGRVLLEAPYRRQVTGAEVEALISFCSDRIEAIARISHRGLRPLFKTGRDTP